MSLISNIKNLLMLIALLFLLNACGGGSSSPSTKSENSDTLATSTTDSAPITTSALSSEQETKVPEISTGTSLATSTTDSAPITTSALSSEQETKVPEISTGTSLKITSIKETATSEHSERIQWELTEKAMGQVEYGFDTSYGNVTIPEESFDYSTHIQSLTYLEPDSLYHYRIISEDADGNRVVSEDRTFKTKSDGTVSLDLVGEGGSSTPTFSPAVESDPVSTPTYTPATVPNGSIVITGLKKGATLDAAKNNSNILNAILSGGNKSLIIPSGTWYTYDTIYIDSSTTLSFENGAKLQQLPDSSNDKSGHRFVVRTRGSHITLNNPHISQEGINHPHGTNACLAIYGKNATDVTVNGGVLEYGASNCFQGGVSNTTFNGTIFKDSVEHLVYAAGGGRKSYSDPDDRPVGLTFNNCTMLRPGNGLTPDLEANHMQLRFFKNIEINNCKLEGEPKTTQGQYAMLVTGVDGLTVRNSTIKGYKSGIIYAGTQEYYATKNVKFEDVNASPSAYSGVYKSVLRGSPDVIVNMTRVEIENPQRIWGGMVNFDDCTFRFVNDRPDTFMRIKYGKGNFHNVTWDASDSTSSKALIYETGGSATFTGTQTKIAPTDGQSFTWGID